MEKKCIGESICKLNFNGYQIMPRFSLVFSILISLEGNNLSESYCTQPKFWNWKNKTDYWLTYYSYERFFEKKKEEKIQSINYHMTTQPKRLFSAYINCIYELIEREDRGYEGMKFLGDKLGEIIGEDDTGKLSFIYA